MMSVDGILFLYLKCKGRNTLYECYLTFLLITFSFDCTQVLKLSAYNGPFLILKGCPLKIMNENARLGLTGLEAAIRCCKTAHATSSDFSRNIEPNLVIRLKKHVRRNKHEL